jgi:hypothetical protein
VTAQASSYVTAQASVAASKIDLSPVSVTLTADPQSVYYSNITEVSAYVLADGAPLTGANVKFTSDSNGTFSGIHEEGAGYYRANFTTPTHTSLSNITLTVSVSAAGCLNASATSQVAVSAPPTPVTNQTANPAASTLVLHVVDINGDPVADAQVLTATQPAGIKQLTGTTNQSGYVKFNGTKAGYYAFDISKDGYSPISPSLNYTGKPCTFTLAQTPADNTLLIIAPVVAVVLIVAITVTVIKRRHRGSSKKGLEPLNWPMPH